MEKKFKIVAVHYEGTSISKVKLDSGEVLDYNKAIDLASEQKIEGVTIGATRGDYSMLTLKGVNDGDPSNNLSNLPRF